MLSTSLAAGGEAELSQRSESQLHIEIAVISAIGVAPDSHRFQLKPGGVPGEPQPRLPSVRALTAGFESP